MADIISDLTAGAAAGLFTGIGNFVTSVRTAITGKAVLTDAEQTALLQQAAQIEAAANQANVQLQLAQANINAVDASSKFKFQAYARPAAIWVCVLGLFYSFLVQPLFPWLLRTVCVLTKRTDLLTLIPALPPIDTVAINTLLFGLLGLTAGHVIENVTANNAGGAK
jgi:hypothetical protein